MHTETHVMLSTHKNSCNLGNAAKRRSRTLTCLRPVTDVFQVKIRWAEAVVPFACELSIFSYGLSG